MREILSKNKKDLFIYFGFLAAIIFLILIAVLPQYKEAVSNQKAYEPIAIDFGILSIRWYAVFIISGIILASIMGYYEFKKMGINTEHLYDGLLIVAPLSILGARLYYIIFDPTGFPSSFWKIFAIWEGGLAIHGAIISATILTIFIAKWKKMNIFLIFDIIVVGLLMGQIVGRWGNFMNAEAHGGITTNKSLIDALPKFLAHQMKFSSYMSNLDGKIYQPTFLYESLWNLLGLTILMILRRIKLLKVGDMLGLYLIWYGFGRAYLVEPYRTDQLRKIFNVPVNILLSYILFVGGGILYLILKRVFYKGKYYVEFECN